MPRTKAPTRYLYIEHGSQEHRNLLGVDAQRNPEAKKDLEEALTTRPVPIATNKTPDKPGSIPWLSHKSEVLPNGWVRKGD